MTDLISHRGPDGCGHWFDGAIGLGHKMLYSTPESLHERQPAVAATGELVVTADARIDNRGELIAGLRLNGNAKEQITDAELILKAYEKWGERCPGKIIGDFAFAIWDSANRCLFCARDALGIKPFYYYSDSQKFLFGSELRQIFAEPSVQHEPNEGMIAEYLACELASQEETLYRGIFRLPPGHSLLVGPLTLRKERYWDIDPSQTLGCKSDGDYAEQFLALFKETLRSHLRSYRPVGIYLSGGLDSSSIVALAQSLYRDGLVAGPGIEAFALVFPGLACDESAYIEEVVKMWGLKCNVTVPDRQDTALYAEQACRYRDLPDYPNAAILNFLRPITRQQGVRVLLTGLGGDEWLTGSYYHHADLLRKLKILDAIRQIRTDATVPGVVFPSFPFLRLGLWPLLPQGARHAIKKVLRRQDMPPLWVNPQFARRNRLIERLRGGDAKIKFASLAQRDLHQSLNSGWHSHLSEIEERSAAWFGLEQRHPFNDRRIVEFAFSLPEEQRWRRDQPKFILRQAMVKYLPEVIRQRRTKAEFSHLFAESLTALGGERLFTSLAIEAMGWVDGARVKRMYQQMAGLYAAGDQGYTKHVWPLWMIFGIELWFKTLFVDEGRVATEEFRIQPSVTPSFSLNN
jgi:asparagine synthase (glutamine-hydrolysing)